MFKISHFLWLASLLLVTSATQAQPASKKLPAPVAATMPTRILDIATYRIAPAPGAPKMLIHLWAAPRRNPDAGGTFHAPAGTFKGKVTVAEVNSFDSLYTTAFNYDIFAPNGKGGWNYLNSIIYIGTSAPSAPEIRYLNNVTKQGLVLELDQFGGQYITERTLYVLRNLEAGSSFFTRDFSNVHPPANSGGVSQGFGRDARGYVQLIKSEAGQDETTGKLFNTRTVFNWDENTGDWKAGRPIVSERK